MYGVGHLGNRGEEDVGGEGDGEGVARLREGRRLPDVLPLVEETAVHPERTRVAWHGTNLLEGIRFRVEGSGCRVQGLGFRVQGAGFRVWGLRFRV